MLIKHSQLAKMPTALQMKIQRGYSPLCLDSMIHTCISESKYSRRRTKRNITALAHMVISKCSLLDAGHCLHEVDFIKKFERNKKDYYGKGNGTTCKGKY